MLPPISTAGLTATDVDELTHKTRELMLKELIALTETPLGRKAITVDVGAGEEDLARLATKSDSGRGSRSAVASGVER